MYTLHYNVSGHDQLSHLGPRWRRLPQVRGRRRKAVRAGEAAVDRHVAEEALQGGRKSSRAGIQEEQQVGHDQLQRILQEHQHGR